MNTKIKRRGGVGGRSKRQRGGRGGGSREVKHLYRDVTRSTLGRHFREECEVVCGRSRQLPDLGLWPFAEAPATAEEHREEQRKETRADRSARAERRRHKIPRWRPRGEKKCWSTASRRPRAGRRPPPACPSDEGTPPRHPLSREKFLAQKERMLGGVHQSGRPVGRHLTSSPSSSSLLLERRSRVCAAPLFSPSNTRGKYFYSRALGPRLGCTGRPESDRCGNKLGLLVTGEEERSAAN